MNAGKKFTMTHIMHYCRSQNWVLLTVPWGEWNAVWFHVLLVCFCDSIYCALPCRHPIVISLLVHLSVSCPFYITCPKHIFSPLGPILHNLHTQSTLSWVFAVTLNQVFRSEVIIKVKLCVKYFFSHSHSGS